jgi:hypothetical protein
VNSGIAEPSTEKPQAKRQFCPHPKLPFCQKKERPFKYTEGADFILSLLFTNILVLFY